MSEETTQATEQPTEAVTATKQQTEVTRPDHVAEKFWDAERNEVKVDELSASYNALEKRLV